MCPRLCDRRGQNVFGGWRYQAYGRACGNQRGITTCPAHARSHPSIIAVDVECRAADHCGHPRHAMGFGANLAVLDLTVMSERRIATHKSRSVWWLATVRGHMAVADRNRASKGFSDARARGERVEAQSIGLVNYAVPSDKEPSGSRNCRRACRASEVGRSLDETRRHKQLQDSLNLVLDTSIATRCLRCRRRISAKRQRAFCGKAQAHFHRRLAGVSMQME